MLRRVAALLTVLLLVTIVAHAETVAVDEIAIQGNRRVESNAIRAVLTVKPGTSVPLEEVDRSLRAIFALGKFSDVTAEQEERDGKRLLLFKVVERPLLRSIAYSGYDEIGEEKLRAQMPLRTPEIYDPAAVDRAVAALRKFYADEGFYAARIEPQLAVDERNEARLTFAIREGEKVLIKELRFEGNTIFEASELRKAMETKERWWLVSWMTDRGKYQEEILKVDLERIADLYFDRGYIQVKVHQPQIALVEENEAMVVTIEIEEGEQFTVGEIDVAGDLIKDRQALLKLVSLSEGEVFSRKRLRQSVLAINDLYADQGYAYVNVVPLSSPDPEQRKIGITLQIEQGVQVRIDRIEIHGNDKTRDKVIRRELLLAEGDLYSASALKESRRRVNNLGFFEDVKIDNAKGSSPERMNLAVEVKEKPTGTFSLGFGYSSVDKFVGQGSVTQENFLGYGWKMNLSGAFGSRSTTYQVGLTDPYFLDTRLTLGFDLYNTEREWTDFTKKATGGDIKVGYPVTANTRVNGIYRYEKKRIYDIDPSASLLIRSQAGESTLSSVYASVVRDTTDYRLDPTSGTVANLSLEFAGLGGTERFAKIEGEGRYFYPLFWNTVFAFRGHLGYIMKVGGEEIPVDERFYLGGLHSVRGFKARELGPRVRNVSTVYDPTTGGSTEFASDYEYIGGNKAAYFNFEYQFPLVKEAGIKGLFFYDAGNAWEEGREFFADMRHSAGAGIRWFSPLGPLRLEWGYNLDPRDGERRSDLEFSIGTMF